jgi:Helix-turn-helix family
MERPLARRLWFGLEPIHGMIYFVPEGPEAYEEVGVTGSRAGYFASRSAPMGAVSAATVTATFYNFHPDLVHRALDGVWERVAPEAVTEARLLAVDRSLRRLLGDDVVASSAMREAATLARRAAEAVSVAGRPLAAAHLGLAWPDEPHLALWHALTVLREHRGDGHVAALVMAGVGPCEALLLHGGSGEVPSAVLQTSRAWPDDEWAQHQAGLVAAGLLDDTGRLTAEGLALREGYETQTDELAADPWRALGADGREQLYALARPWAKSIVAEGGLGLR